MDHVVYLDTQAKEVENLLNGLKTMIIRGAMGRKIPHGRVQVGDVLYFINNNAEGKVRAKCIVSSATHSERLSREESRTMIAQYQPKLRLTEKQFTRWAGKRYLVFIEVADVTEISPFIINRREYGNMDDWLLVGDINTVKN